MTETQKDVFIKISKLLRNKFPVSPSLVEVAEATGKSKGHISKIAHALKDQGFITFIPHRARTIGLTDKGTATLERMGVKL